MRVQGIWAEPDKRIYWQFTCLCKPGLCSPGGYHRLVHGGIPGYEDAAWCPSCNTTGVRPEGESLTLCLVKPADIAEGEVWTAVLGHDQTVFPVPHPDHEQPWGTASPGYRESWKRQFESSGESSSAGPARTTPPSVTRTTAVNRGTCRPTAMDGNFGVDLWLSCELY